MQLSLKPMEWVQRYLASMNMLVVAINTEGEVAVESAGWQRWKDKYPEADLTEFYRTLTSCSNTDHYKLDCTVPDEAAGEHKLFLRYASAPSEDLQVRGLWSIQDKSEEKSLQAKLQRSVKRLKSVQEAANDGIWEWDLDTEVMTVSDRGLNMLGYRRDQVTETKDWWFSQIHKDDLPRILGIVERHLAGESAVMKAEFRLEKANNTYMWVLARGVAVQDEENGFNFAAGSLTDVHARHMSEQRYAWEAEHAQL
ncbi:MAG: PAS domain-containing protein, partial [Gammaproteobacteria bacterium]|nr:PAS domain-containing protein [Gammaproteobacteria bacterium]